MKNYIVIAIILISVGASIFGYYRLKIDNDKREKKDFLALFIGQLIPLFALIIPMLFPQEGTKVFFPEMEKKIEENKTLKKEISEKDKIISNSNLEEDKLNKKLKNLSAKNYADLKKVNLVEDGLKKDNQVSIATVDDSQYIEAKDMASILDQSIQYDEVDGNLYVGGKSGKVTKEALVDDYSILYSGSNYKSFGDPDRDIPEDYTVAGKELSDGFIIESSSYQDSYVLIRLDDKYSSIAFDVGKADVTTGSDIENGKLSIELDGKEKYKETVNAEIASQQYQFDVTGAKTLKLSMTKSSSEFAFYNVTFTKK